MTVRHVTENDAAIISEIYSYYVKNTSYSFEYDPPGADEMLRRIRDTVKFYPYLVCEENGEICGFAYAHRHRERKAYQWLCELSVYVKHGFTGKGVARTLYEEIIPITKKQKFLRAIAVVSTPNEASEAFHRKMGFKPVAVLPNMGYKFGAWHDLVYYELELNEVTVGEDPAEPVPYFDL